MTALWMPPLPEPNAWRVDASFFAHYDSIPFALLPPVGDPKPLYTTDQMQKAQADAARAALERAIQACEAEYTIEGIAQRCADAIRMLAREVQHD